MRRFVIGLVATLLMLATAPAVAQETPAYRFAMVAGYSGVGPALDAVAADPLSTEARQQLRDAIAEDRAALLLIAPDECLLETYVGYLEALTLGDAAMDLADAFELTATTAVIKMMNEKVLGLDANALQACL